MRFAPARNRAARDSSAARREVDPPWPQQSDGPEFTRMRGPVAILCGFSLKLSGTPKVSLTTYNCEIASVEPRIRPNPPLAVDAGCSWARPVLPPSQCDGARRRPLGAVPSEASARGGIKPEQASGNNGAPYCFDPARSTTALARDTG